MAALKANKWLRTHKSTGLKVRSPSFRGCVCYGTWYTCAYYTYIQISEIIYFVFSLHFWRQPALVSLLFRWHITGRHSNKLTIMPRLVILQCTTTTAIAAECTPYKHSVYLCGRMISIILAINYHFHSHQFEFHQRKWK